MVADLDLPSRLLQVETAIPISMSVVSQRRQLPRLKLRSLEPYNTKVDFQNGATGCMSYGHRFNEGGGSQGDMGESDQVHMEAIPY